MNLSYMWNFDSLLAVCLVIEIVTGIRCFWEPFKDFYMARLG